MIRRNQNNTGRSSNSNSKCGSNSNSCSHSNGNGYGNMNSKSNSNRYTSSKSNRCRNRNSNVSVAVRLLLDAWNLACVRRFGRLLVFRASGSGISQKSSWLLLFSLEGSLGCPTYSSTDGFLAPDPSADPFDRLCVFFPRRSTEVQGFSFLRSQIPKPHT